MRTVNFVDRIHHVLIQNSEAVRVGRQEAEFAESGAVAGRDLTQPQGWQCWFGSRCSGRDTRVRRRRAILIASVHLRMWISQWTSCLRTNDVLIRTNISYDGNSNILDEEATET